ncbi:MAG: ribonuclease-3 [Bacteriovoracaceae bacterium]|jgi:ribonuclease-3
MAWFFENLKLHPQYDHLFKDLDNSKAFVEALCHTSFEHENESLNFNSYERLEFLGDAVLDLLVSKKLLNNFPELEEGPLSKLRGALVNEESLSEIARVIGLGDLILVGKGEFKNGGLKKNAILADVVESVIAVFYMELGIDGAEVFLDKIIKLLEIETKTKFYDLAQLESFDSKTKLQEKTMSLYKEHPVYEADTLANGHFEVKVLLKDQTIASMTHQSKKKAEKILAKKILNNKLYEEVTHVN